MSTLVLYASPNNDGNTKMLLNSFINGLEEDVKIINVYNSEVKPCLDCGYCKKIMGECSIKDDMTEIYNLIEISDNIVIASPMYFGMVPAPLKAVIDRTQMIWSNKKCFNIDENKTKKGILLFTAGTVWNDMFKPMELICKYFFKTIDCKLVSKVYVNNTDNIKVRENKEVLDKSFNAGKQLTKIVC
jgi:multimeric flavodoxin WrbA